ncbi:MAG: hypothetical protein HQ556_05265 [Candidatus Marinimicrobia bacterium]|nr:hypothetical protein [Candidatus Neomarinimicrobiota bacterium]
MRKRFQIACLIVLIGLVSLPTFAIGQAASDSLTSTEPMMKGHLVALYLSHLMEGFTNIVDYDAPIMVGFNESEAKIEIDILGGQTTIDRAKKSTDSFRLKLLAISLDALNEHFNLSLSEDDIVISYFDKAGPKQLLTFRDGNYTIE